MIKQESIREVLDKNDIIDVIGEYVKISKRGKNFLALCPFHHEKTPSFTVSQEKQLWHCFGCGAGGTLLDFIMKIDNSSFTEAVQKLGDRAGVKIERDSGREPAGGFARLNQVLAAACEFYKDHLRGPHGAAARDYLIKKRGLTPETIDRFSLGLAPADGGSLFQFLGEKGFSPAAQEEAGLIIRRENEASYYDRFRNRIIFPIFDPAGRPVSFGGRIWEAEGQPKYLNGPETPAYSKSKNLYGLNLAKDAVKKENFILIVEGYLDCIACSQAGIANTAAPLGTAFTLEQAKLISRFTSEVIVAFDEDAAGQTATWRGLEILRQIDLFPKVARLSGGKDPDEIIKNQGLDFFKKIIKEAQPWLDFALDKLIGRGDASSPEGKAKIAKAVFDFLAVEPNHILRSEYVKKLAKRLAIPENTLQSQYEDQQKKAKQPAALGRQPRPPKTPARLERAEQTLLLLAASRQAFRTDLSTWSGPSEIFGPILREIYKVITEAAGEEDNISQRVLDQLSPEAKKKFLEISLGEVIANEAKTFADCLRVLEQSRLEKAREDLKVQLLAAEKNGRPDLVKDLSRKMMELYQSQN